MNKKLIITGEINKKGVHGFANIDQFEKFARQYPNSNTIITIQVEDKKSNESILAYYYAKVLPDWQNEMNNRGITKNKKQIDVLLRNGFPLLKFRNLSDLNYEELIYFMDYVKFKSLEEMNLVIEESRVF